MKKVVVVSIQKKCFTPTGSVYVGQILWMHGDYFYLTEDASTGVKLPIQVRLTDEA